jgi:uncharacterized membrane protein YraQ (UPF0718 family)
MAKLPVYVVTGFLDSGKTTFINRILRKSDVKSLVVRFESGAATLNARNALAFSKKRLETEFDGIPAKIAEQLQSSHPDEVWIEWNGATPFTDLHELLGSRELRDLCALRRVVHIADAERIAGQISGVGATLCSQIAESDVAFCRGLTENRGVTQMLRAVAPSVRVCDADTVEPRDKRVLSRGRAPLTDASLLFGAVAVTLFILAAALSGASVSAVTIYSAFLGIMLQAIPFLLIGVLLSSAIEVYVPVSVIERWFPKNPVAGMLVAVGAGFLLPVCDCASIPIFRSLIRKGVPTPAAVTFMLATPVINPVVVISTYYAFSGDLSVVAARVALGIIAAVIVGIVTHLRPPESVGSGGVPDSLLCDCAGYGGPARVLGLPDKLSLFIRHAQSEFWGVGKYLAVGCFLAAAFQAVGFGANAVTTGYGLAASVVAMMAASFLLSLCSSSDAVIARSFANQLPVGALMGFMVFGPMMDIKNILMLSSGFFTRRFIGRLVALTFIVCFGVVFAAYSLNILG